MPDVLVPGTAYVRYPTPHGSGGPPSLITNGVKPGIGTSDTSTQYDSFIGGPPAGAGDFDFIGITFNGGSRYQVHRVLFQEGMQFPDGGWFDSFELQLRVEGVWVAAKGVVVIPGYPFGDNGITFEEYEFLFQSQLCDAVRLYGKPGGAATFVSCGEFQVYGVFYPGQPMSIGVSIQEPPYSGPYDPLYYKNPPFATQDNPRNDEVRWCERCQRPVVVDNRPLFLHKHFREDDSVEIGP